MTRAGSIGSRSGVGSGRGRQLGGLPACLNNCLIASVGRLAPLPTIPTPVASGADHNVAPTVESRGRFVAGASGRLSRNQHHRVLAGDVRQEFKPVEAAPRVCGRSENVSLAPLEPKSLELLDVLKTV